MEGQSSEPGSGGKFSLLNRACWPFAALCCGQLSGLGGEARILPVPAGAPEKVVLSPNGAKEFSSGGQCARQHSNSATGGSRNQIVQLNSNLEPRGERKRNSFRLEVEPGI